MRSALGRNAIPTLSTERVDAIPLLLEQRPRMGLPTLLDTPCPTHGHWTGLRLGGVRTIWLRAIVARGDPRGVSGAPGGAPRLWPLETTPGPAVTRRDCTADRLAIVPRCLSDAPRWAACASALPQPTVRVYDWAPERVQVERTRARA